MSSVQIFSMLHFIMLMMTPNFFLSYVLSIHLSFAYLSLPISIFISLTLYIYLSHSLVHTWLSSSHRNIFREEVIFSVTHPAVHCYAIWCKQTLNSGDDIADDFKWCTTQDMHRKRKPGVNNQSVSLSCSPVEFRKECQTCLSADDGHNELHCKKKWIEVGETMKNEESNSVI